MSTPNKVIDGNHFQSMSSDSRCSLTSSEPEAGGIFAFPSSSGLHCTRFTTATCISGSQHITSSRWHPPALLSPLHLQGLDPLTTEQATKLYQLASECQALGSDLAKRFQTLCSLEITHCATAQATTHETVFSEFQAHSAACGLDTATQPVEQRKLTLHRLCEAANKVWKDANRHHLLPPAKV